MKNLKTLSAITVFYLLLFNLDSSAQSVGINSTGSAPDASALLDLSSTDKGFLITRVDTANVIFPAFGLMTLAPIDSCLYLYNGIKWIGMGGGGSDCNCNCNSVSPFKCGDSYTDKRDNESYESIKIGDQCWMTRNLNFTPSSGKSWCYNNDPAKCIVYGRLYDWNTSMNNASSSITNPSGVKGICPTDWHVPSDSEWKELEMYLGMSQAAADGTSFRGTNEGDQLKALSFGGTNSSGFTALLGGNRYINGSFYVEGFDGHWWSTTQSGTDVLYRGLSSVISGVYRYPAVKEYGFSVRCVRD